MVTWEVLVHAVEQIQCRAGSKGQALSPRSPLQSPYSPGGLGPSPDAMRTRPNRNAAFIDYKRDVQEGRNLDQVNSICPVLRCYMR